MNNRLKRNRSLAGRKRIFILSSILFLYFACAIDSADSRRHDQKNSDTKLTVKFEYNGGFVNLRWEPVVPVKIKMKYEEGSKSDWFYLTNRKKVGEEKIDGEIVAKYENVDTFDSGDLKVAVPSDNIVLFEFETLDGRKSDPITIKTISPPLIYINSYDDLTFRLELSVSPYAEKILIERKGEGESDWRLIKEVSVEAGKNYSFEDKVPNEGIWFYRARSLNSFGDSGYSREFFASPVVCSARRASRIKGKAAGCGWPYRRTITVTNNSTPESDVVIRVTLDTQTLISSGKMKADCSDIRFTDQSDEIFLPYWIGINRQGQSTCNTAQTTIWVKIPYLPSGANTIYMYYGNENADAVSDPKNVFVYFDNIESYTVGQSPPSGWTTLGSGILQVGNDSGNKVIIKGCFNTASGCSPAGGGGDPSGGYRELPYPVSNFIGMARVKRVDITSGAPADRRDSIGLEDLNNDGYSFFENTQGDLIGIARRDNGSGTDLASAGVVLTDTGEWNLFVFYKVGSSLTFELSHAGGTSTISASDNNHIVFSRFAIRGGRDYYVDDIAIAKYANVSVSVGSEAASSYTGLFFRRIPLTLNSTQELRDFQVAFEIPITEPITTGKIRNDCGDLRFSDSPYFEVDLWGLSFPYYFEARGPCGGDATLSGWWKFDENSGTSASDSSGNVNTGTLSSGASWGEGKYASGIDLTPNGTADYVSIGGAPLNGKSDVSVSVWVRWTGSAGANAAILSASGSGSDNEFLIYKNGANLAIYIKGGFYTFSGAGTTLESPGWHHVVAVRKDLGTDSRVFLYIDGNPVNPSTGGVITGAGGTLNVGCIVVGQESDLASCGNFDPNQDWEGYVDDLRIFSRELAPYEVRMLYQGKARVWVKIPYISVGNQTLYAYFGNSSKTSINSGDKTFEFFDDFSGSTLNTNKWNANSIDYSVNYGSVIRTGNFVSKFAVAHSNVGRDFEILTRWQNSNAAYYAGINIADDDRTAGSNTQADCVAYWMTQSGDNPAGPTEQLTIWGAEGDAASYDVVGGTSLYTINEWDWYIGGFGFSSSQFIYYIYNGFYSSLNTLTYNGQWRGGLVGTGDKTPEQEPGAPYLFLGDFQGLNAGTGNDIDDIEIKWVRVKKRGTQPTISYGAIEDSTE